MAALLFTGRGLSRLAARLQIGPLPLETSILTFPPFQLFSNQPPYPFHKRQHHTHTFSNSHNIINITMAESKELPEAIEALSLDAKSNQAATPRVEAEASGSGTKSSSSSDNAPIPAPKFPEESEENQSYVRGYNGKCYTTFVTQAWDVNCRQMHSKTCRAKLELQLKQKHLTL